MYRPYFNKLNELLAEYELFSSQWLIMSLLQHEGPLTLVEIADRRAVEKPTITRMVRRLKELGYVESVSGQDRREKITQLTDVGLEVCADVQRLIEQLQLKALSGITEQEQQEASRVLAKIGENLKM